MCPGGTITCICATGNSSALAWTINGTRLEFMSSDPLMTRHNVFGPSTYAVLTESSDTNGISVIMSNLTLSVSMSSNDPSIILMCENVDRTISEPVIIPIAGKHCEKWGEYSRRFS